MSIDDKSKSTQTNPEGLPEQSSDIQQEDQQPSLASRRAAIRKILAGGGIIAGAQSLPGEWTKPIVNSVIAPAHAVTSTTAPPTPTPAPR